VVGLTCQLGLASNYLDIRIIDVTLFPDRAEKYNIRAVPTIVIDGQDKLVGTVSEEILTDRLVARTPSNFHPDTFKKIVKEGDAARLAAMMIAEEKIYAGALELLNDPDWSVRLGMMVVLEEVAGSRPDLVPMAYPFVLALLEHEDTNRRGDAAYLLGSIGDTGMLERLRSLTADENPEVAAAAEEAVQMIRSRHCP
jgi:HEAT repeat protein